MSSPLLEIELITSRPSLMSISGGAFSSSRRARAVSVGSVLGMKAVVAGGISTARDLEPALSILPSS